MSNGGDYEMIELEERPSTSKAAAAKLSIISSYHNNTDDVVDDGDKEHQDESTLWSIDDDTMFFARGLMNHSAGKGKSVFATWNENYLINFVFKTSSKSKKTSMTKVRLNMPLDRWTGEPEEIMDMLILELNTLLLMRSGRVYNFSSVKSIHPVVWLEEVRCVAACPLTQFSVIRFQDNLRSREQGSTTKQLLLEVYQDIAQLGKCPSRTEALRHCYDISFDLRNAFNCQWHDERYVLLSLITHKDNIDFLRKLLAIANFLSSSSEEERVTIELNQEVHIFTVSGNLFMLVGTLISENYTPPSNPNVEDCSIHLLNTYAANIECIQIDFNKNLLMVLLQSGHMDIWYKSHKMLGTIQHLSHELTYFTHYDYDACDNTFYITGPEEVTQIKVIYSKDTSICECRIHEVHKAICGIIACTWVASLQQLVCLSYNNIFYRLCFLAKSNGEENFKDIDIKYENYQVLYALTSKKIKELMSKAQIVNELMELPAQLHDAIEMEFQKQQLLSLGYKRKLWQKLIHSHIEYHKSIPAQFYFDKDVLLIKASFDCSVAPQQEGDDTMYALIYMSLTKNDTAFLKIIQTSTWYLEICCQNSSNESILLHIPAEILSKRICFIISYNTVNSSSKNKELMPDFIINLRTFIQHSSEYICLNIDIEVLKNKHTYSHIFSNDNVQQLALLQNHQLHPDCLIKVFKQRNLNNVSSSQKTSKSQVKQVLKIRKSYIIKILKEAFNIIYDTIPSLQNFKIYFLQLYPLHLNYDENLQFLTITTEHLESLLYFKLYLMHHMSSSCIKSEDLTESCNEESLKIMQLQANVERIYGSLLSSPECLSVDSGTISLHLENLHKVYLKLRCEFNDIFR